MSASDTIPSATRLSLIPGPTRLVVAVRGSVDGPGARRLCDLLEGALAGDPVRRAIELDLSGVDQFTAEGLQGLVACTRVEGPGAERVRLRVGGAGAPVRPV